MSDEADYEITVTRGGSVSVRVRHRPTGAVAERHDVTSAAVAREECITELREAVTSARTDVRHGYSKEDEDACGCGRVAARRRGDSSYVVLDVVCWFCDPRFTDYDEGESAS